MTAMKKLICLVLALCMLSIPCVLAAESAGTTGTTGTTSTATGTTNTTDTAAQDTQAASSAVSSSADAAKLPADTKTGNAITFSDVDYNSELGKAVEKLVDNEVISGFPDGTFKGEQTLTRAEFAKIIVSFVAGAETAVNLDSGFPDVDNVGGSSHWAKAYIKVAKDLKIISGFPDGTFKPDDPVTYEQAVKMIMCSLNYTDYTYPDGFMQVALQKKLLTGSLHKGENSAAITRASVAMLMNNAYSVPENKVSSLGGLETIGSSSGSSSSGKRPSGGGGGGGGGGGSSSSSSSSSSTEYSRKIYAVVVGTEFTMLDSNKSLDENEVAVKYTKSDSKTGTSTEVTEVLTLPDAFRGDDKRQTRGNLLGRKVQATIKERDGKEYISDIKLSAGENYEITVRSENIMEITYDSTEKTATITYANGEESDSVTFATENAYIIYNGNSINVLDEANPEREYSFDPSYLLNFKMGEITVLATDKSIKNAKAIFIKDYKTAVVKNRPNADTGIINLSYGNGSLNAKATGDRVVNIYNDGFNMALADIRSGDIVDYAMSVDGKMLEILVNPISDKTTYLAGTVYSVSATSVTISKDGKKTSYSFNANYLDYLANYTGKDKYIPIVDDEVTVYFNNFRDFDGDQQIAEIVMKDDSSTYSLGYIYAMYFAESSTDKSHETPNDGDKGFIVMYDMSRGTGVTYELKEKVKVDGKDYNDQLADVQTLLKSAATISNTGKGAEQNSVLTYAQLVRFKADVLSGKISEIDTILDDTGAVSTEISGRYNKLVRSTYVYDESEELGGKYKYSSASRKFYKKTTSDGIAINSSTKWLFVPGKRSNVTSYKTGTGTSRFSDGVQYYIEAYSMSEQTTATAEIILQFIADGTGAIKYSSTQAVVIGVDQPQKDDPVSITLMTSSGTQRTYQRHEDSPVSEDDFMKLNKGDVILFSMKDNYIYDYYQSLNIKNLPVKRVDKKDLLYCGETTDDRRIKAFSSTPGGKQADKDSIRRAYYLTWYGTAVDITTGTSGGELTVSSLLSTDYIEPSAEYNEMFNYTYSGLKVFVYDDSQKNEEDVLKLYTKAADVQAFLEDDEQFITVARNSDDYEGATHVFLYAYTNSSSDNAIKYLYIIKSASQQNDPEKYDGVKDPVDTKKDDAKLEINGSYPISNYMKITQKYAEVLSAAYSEIDAATTIEGVEAALANAKTEFDKLVKDSEKTAAIEGLKALVTPSEHSYKGTDMTDALTTAEDEINALALKEDLEQKVTDVTATLVELLREDAIAEIDAYAMEKGLTEDTDYATSRDRVQDETTEAAISDIVTEVKALIDSLAD